MIEKGMRLVEKDHPLRNARLVDIFPYLRCFCRYKQDLFENKDGSDDEIDPIAEAEARERKELLLKEY